MQICLYTISKASKWTSWINVGIAGSGKGDYGNAISHFLFIIEKDRMWNDEAPRKNLLEIFNALGPADELAIEGRKKLSSILFS